jgi:hypothetical protein
MTFNPVVRNVLIVAALAAAVAFIPGGGTTASVIVTAIALGFLASFAWIGMIMYREHRATLYSLGDSRRTALYAAAAVLAITLTATSKLWATPAGSIAWLVLVGAAVYVGVAVVLAARRY